MIFFLFKKISVWEGAIIKSENSKMLIVLVSHFCVGVIQ